ncbi:hypothetical protein ACJMK2_033886 [Sinanodonta woodiana]|uniref:Cadherin domain-containing protein n=1 Tax=Sinanodonta woodiana TaxID=1069815 RepID=A0ABD3WQD3_SINWO
MDKIIYLLVISSVLCSEASSKNCIDVINSINNIHKVSETDPPGTVIFNVSKGPSDNITYTIANSFESAMQPYFRYFQNVTLYAFSLNRTLDLEELYSILGYDVQTIAFDFSCGRITQRTTIYVVQENEFNPSINTTGDLNIPENANVGTIVYRLRERVLDTDRPASTFSFLLTSTGDGTFALVSALTGDIKLASPLDFESGHTSYILNITVTDTIDSTARTGHALLRVNILDADDQGPAFVFPGCFTPCLIPEYTADVEPSYTGPLTIQPAAIKAIDLDTLNYPITYSIYDDAGSSSYNKSSGFFKIESSNGTMYQLRPASQVLWRTQRLVVIAEKVGSMQPPAYAVITVRVSLNDSTIDKSELPGDPKLDGQSLTSAVIAVSVVLGITIIASVIIIFTLWHRYRKLAFQDYSLPRGVIQEHSYLSIDLSKLQS